MPKMSAAKTFLRLPRRRRRAIAAAVRALLSCRFRLQFQKVEALRIWAGRPGQGSGNAGDLAFAIKIASKYLPSITCLARALSLQRLLSANGHVSELTIGVDNADGVFGAHAWLSCEGRILIGGEEAVKFRPLTVWRAPFGSTEAIASKQKAQELP